MRVHLAPAGLEDVVRDELGRRVIDEAERLFLVNDELPCRFAQDTWLDARWFSFNSISEAAGHLRALQRNWWLHSVRHHRRAQLIRGRLPVLKPKPLAFLSSVPSAPLGAWTLWDENTLLCSAACASAFPDGEIYFVENKSDPPSRAYLKLWELFTLCGRSPSAGQRVIDLGSSPGGWTWVLDQLGCSVVSVDKAPLAAGLALSPRVEYRDESAFALDPANAGDVDWMFSDIICYPERLLELVRRWEGHARNMVCTIKFQGKTDFARIDEFLRIPGSDVRHLFHNKHELTWYRLEKL